MKIVLEIVYCSTWVEYHKYFYYSTTLQVMCKSVLLMTTTSLKTKCFKETVDQFVYNFIHNFMI